jgi:hypothetical protein
MFIITNRKHNQTNYGVVKQIVRSEVVTGSIPNVGVGSASVQIVPLIKERPNSK